MRYLFFILTMSFWAISAFSQELPDAIKGKWQVTEVHINTDSPRTPFYAWNDPRLVGRLFTFDGKAITNDTSDDSECLTPRARTTSIRFQELISKSMWGYGYPSKNATAHDYRLDVGQAENTKVIQMYCKDSLWNEDLGLDDGVRGSWLFFLMPIEFY